MSTTTPQDVKAALGRALHEHWGLFLAEGIILVILGLLAIIVPPLASLAVTIFIGWLFLIGGILSIILAIEHRRELVGRWGWILLSGIVDLIIAIIIWAGLPGTAAWALGLLVGIDLVFGGTALIMVALHAKRGASAAA